MEGVGDVEEACYLGLKPGSRILLWYADDSVWHEAMVGLVLGGEEIVMYTPDKDLYVEAVGCKGDYGPIRLRGLLPNGNLPRNLRARAYRFREKVTDELIRQVFRDALSLADGEDRHYIMPTQAVDQAFEVVSIDALFGGKFLRTRLPRGRGREEVPGRHDGGSPVGTPKNAKVVEPAMGDYVWVSAEPLGGLILGQEVSLNAETDVQCGPRHAMALRRGEWVKVEMIQIGEAADYASKRRSLFGHAATPGSGECPPEPVGAASETKGAKAVQDEDDKEVRTLWVDYDEHGERFKRWRDVCCESYAPTFGEKPLEGPCTALHTIKHTERHGGDPRLWLQLWMRSKHIESGDRTYHEMKVLVDSLYFAGTFDQVNIPALMAMEVICRRIQAIVDAYSNPSRPSWENAKIFAGQGGPEDIVSPTFRTYAQKKNKEELELMQARQKVRELRGSPAVSQDDVDPSDSLPSKPNPKGAPKRKGNKGGQQGQGDG